MNAEIKFEIDGQDVPPHQLDSMLPNKAASRALARLADKIREHLGHTRCPIHDEPPHITVVMSSRGSGFRTTGCCDPFVDVTNQAVNDIINQSTRPSSYPRLMIAVQGVIKPFVFDTEFVDELVIGRFDPDTGTSPDIDLHRHNAYEFGVSRQHAAIVWRNGALNIVDNGAPNGTFLNGQRLVAKQPHSLRDGDLIRVGRLTLQVTLEYPAAQGRVL
jgi:hypothetical protein